MLCGNVLAALLFSAGLTGAHGHGYLSNPAARNGNSNGATQGVCGSGGWVNTYRGPQATYTAGQVVEFQHVITAHHYGHFEMKICEQRINSSTAGGATACLNKWILERVEPSADCVPNDSRTDCQPVDTRHPERFYLPPNRGLPQTDKFRFRIPEGLQCEECTLQWRWCPGDLWIPFNEQKKFDRFFNGQGGTRRRSFRRL